MEQKRPRGRPKGTEINDGRYLDQVADLMVKDRSLKKTPAIARIVEKNFCPHEYSKVERRLLRKWNKSAEQRLEAARERQVETRKSVGYTGGGIQLGAAAAAIAAMERSLSIGSSFERLAGIGSAWEAAERVLNLIGSTLPSSLLQASEAVQRAQQQMQDLIDPPYMRAIREHEDMMRRAFGGLSLR